MAALPPHPNVLRLIGHCRRMRPKNGGEEAYMLLELCGQSLASHLQRRAGMGTDGGTPTLRPGSSVASGLGGGSIRGGYSNGHGDHYRDSHDAEEHRRSVYAGGATWEMGLTGGGNGTIGVNKTIGMDPLQTADVLSIFLDMVHAVAHLHSQPAPVAHRDVKPENFLPSTRDGRWKLCDFGSASTETFVYTPGPERDGGTPAALLAFEEERIHRASTPMYRAPEMNDLRSIEEVGPKVDVWALGVSLFKLVFLRDLFGMAGEERLGVLNFDPDARLNRTSALRMLPHGGNPHSEQNLEVLLALMKLCLIKRASERPAARDVLQWIYAQAPIERFLPSSALTTERLYAPGILTLTVVAARNLHGKGSTNAAGGAGCYVVLWCAGVRRSGAKTALTVDGNASWGRGTCELVVPTHSLESLDLAVWGTRPGSSLPDVFLGRISLNLEAALRPPREYLSFPAGWRPLQKRSARSRVAGDLCVGLTWSPRSVGPPPPPPPPPPPKPAPAPAEPPPAAVVSLIDLDEPTPQQGAELELDPLASLMRGSNNPQAATQPKPDVLPPRPWPPAQPHLPARPTLPAWGSGPGLSTEFAGVLLQSSGSNGGGGGRSSNGSPGGSRWNTVGGSTDDWETPQERTTIADEEDFWAAFDAPAASADATTRRAEATGYYHGSFETDFCDALGGGVRDVEAPMVMSSVEFTDFGLLDPAPAPSPTPTAIRDGGDAGLDLSIFGLEDPPAARQAITTSQVVSQSIAPLATTATPMMYRSNGDDWTCQVCTLINRAGSRTCDACESPARSSHLLAPPQGWNQSAGPMPQPPPPAEGPGSFWSTFAPP
mmetsp:Transcript_24478/g.74701  ORF Transcript_24478/g.74701 Transcript_24478/m.74701 type:complete len:829 (+) Transcript_24478:487-2973(+)